ARPEGEWVAYKTYNKELEEKDKEIERLKELVKIAYAEGRYFETGYIDESKY
ncbi:unnamed protein product, partial [marine sediment metagenome]